MNMQPKGIMIFGPSGAGKTTLGKALAENLGLPYIDIDDYIWRKDTAIPFSTMFSREAKISRLRAAVETAGTFVMAGSMDSFHEHFDPYFVLAVHLTAAADVRVERVHNRETAWFGARVQPGGDMYESHRRYLEDVARYDSGGGATSFEVHDRWANSLPCPVLRLDGTRPVEENAAVIATAYRSL